MKELRIPVCTENQIDCSEITSEFPGIVICYLNNKPSGFIFWYDYTFWFSNSIDTDDVFKLDDTIIKSVQEAIDKKYADSFKVIEFD